MSAKQPAKPIARAQRHERRRAYLGQPNPSCFICGYSTNPMAIDKHHVAGTANSGLTVNVCKTHHAELSDLQTDGGRCVLDHRVPRTPLLVAAAILFGIRDLFRQAEPFLTQYADQLVGLNEHPPIDAPCSSSEQTPFKENLS